MKTRFFHLILPDGGDALRPAEFVVDGARFAAFGAPGTLAGSGIDREVSVGGRLVLPGAIDGHVHFDDPGFTHREDFGTGTRAAAAGGVTTIVDMPCTSLPPVTNADALRYKRKVVTPKAQVDFMFWGGVSGNALEDPLWRANVEALVVEGVAAFKLYMLSGMETYRDLSSSQMSEVLALLASLSIPAGVHAEDRDLVARLTAERKGNGKNGPLDYAASRPVEAEVVAVEALIAHCRASGARVHVVHLASGEALDRIDAAREDGLPLSAETCPHYLAFTREDLAHLGSLLKTAPVVKGPEDRERLWEGLSGGGIQHVATDHAAGEWPREKRTGSIWSDYGGVPGVELMVPYLLSEGVGKKRITLERLTELVAAAPARFFGVGGRKGSLAEGFDADFATVDPHETWTVDGPALHNLNRYTPFHGWDLTGRIRQTWVRGERVFSRDPGEEEFGKPAGRFVRRETRA